MMLTAASVAFTASAADAQRTPRLGDSVILDDGSPVAAVKVDLFTSQQGRRVSFVSTTTTDAQGRYEFDVAPGCYGIVFVAPDAMTFTAGREDRWDEQHVCVQHQDVRTVDAKLYRLVPETPVVGGQVSILGSDIITFADGAKVDLFVSTDGHRDGFLGTTRTDQFGNYSFDIADLDPADADPTDANRCYSIVVLALAGHTFTPNDNDRWDEQHRCFEGSNELRFDSFLFPIPTGPSNPACFTPVFRDDFDGTEVDRSQWNLYSADPGNAGFGVRDPATITVADGKLNIEASMHTDGRLHTGGMKHVGLLQSYGYYEVRVRVDPDPSRATSGVVLTWPEANDNPAGGENNIFETHETFDGRPSGDPDRTPVKSFMHYPDSNEADGDSFVSRTHVGSDGKQWAIYAMEWTPGKVVYSHNGVPAAGGPIVGDIIPDHRHNLTIQLDAWRDVMGDPVNMEVDYVAISRYDCE